MLRCMTGNGNMLQSNVTEKRENGENDSSVEIEPETTLQRNLRSAITNSSESKSVGPSRELAEKWTEKSSTIKDSMKKHGGERGVVTKKLAASGEDEIREGGHPVVEEESNTSTLIPPRKTRATKPVRILTRATTSAAINYPTIESTTVPTTALYVKSISNEKKSPRKESVSVPEDKDLPNYNIKQSSVLEKSQQDDKGGESITPTKQPIDATLDTFEDESPSQNVSQSSVTSQRIHSSSDYLEAIIQSLAFAGPGLGILVGHFPITLLLRRFGARKTIAVALLLSVFLTTALPFVAEQGHWCIVAIRFGLGLCFAPALSFIGSNAANWASLKEQLWFIVIGIMALQFAPILSWYAVLNLVDLSRESVIRVFGVHACVTAILLIVWMIFYRDTPQKHRAVNGLELNRIMTGKMQHNRLIEDNVFSLLVKSVSAWVVWLSSFGYFFAFSFIVTFSPLYVFKMLKQPLNKTVLFPFILLFFSHYLAYTITNWLEQASSTLKVRTFNTIALLTSAMSFVALAVLSGEFFMENITAWPIWILWVCLMPLGLVSGGFLESAVVCGRYYAQFILSNLQVSLGLSLTVVPIGVFLLTVDNSMRQWRLIFLIIAVVLSLSAAIFLILGRGQPSSWAHNSWDPTATHKMRSTQPISSYDDCGLIEMRTIDEFINNHPRTSLLGHSKVRSADPV
ncbi:major facilitator superfamily domain-containing protein [Ditylenchus destructor]|uniref:Major facilitator superfamily domain-containing protein n=1 Tax=Ditylenchus destructor TaxID=166010 RepID=A0AAD4RB28_9BILA|nr:major facilitator superfamily domain-containing protein [Ditylenchus destructor]